MLDRYERELAYLRELAREVGERFPEISHLMSERLGDPAVERLLECAALLDARLAERINDELPELMHPLFERRWPQYLRPTPAVTLLQFSARGTGLQQTYLVPEGTPVRSKKVEGQQLGFRTTLPALVPPLDIEAVRMSRPTASDLLLIITFSLHKGLKLPHIGLSKLHLQLMGSVKARAALFLWLTHDARAVSVVAAGETVLRLGRHAIRPLGREPGQGVFPGKDPPLRGFRTLETFFAFPEALYAVEISGLDAIPDATEVETFDLVFHLGPLEGAELLPDASSFALGCVPAINVSDVERVDVEVPRGVSEFRIPLPNSAEVYDVERVGAYEPRDGTWLDYKPLWARRLGKREAGVPRFEVRRRKNDVRPGDVWIVTVDAEGRPQSPASERLSIWATATHGTLAAKLGPGDVAVGAAGTPAFLKFANLSPIRPGLPSAISRGKLARLLALFMAPSETLLDLLGVRRLIDEALPEASDLATRLVTSARSHRAERLHHRLMMPVRRLDLELDDRLLAGPGELYLLGALLKEAISRDDDRSLIELSVRGIGSGAVFRFG